MNSIIEGLRTVLGNPDFYVHLPGSSSTSYSWDYGAMIEYLIGGICLVLAISFAFRFILKVVER